MVRNFKSFSGKLKLNFQPGFNVITGPNGSGKSNIIDAVQFVFGELGSKRMRVPELSGVIFDGAGERGSNPKYAQVTIYLNNSDRALAVDRNTVSVGRRIDTDGKSKYYLNGKKTSRKALLEILEMGGITPGGYNIVLQGMATRLSDLTPSERMTALEDLVGITEYDEKKADAKVRLTEAERKIEVASAKGDEVRRRVVMLERERNDALRHRLLERAEKRLEAYRLSDQLKTLERDIRDNKAKIRENNKEIEAIEADKEKLLVEREEAKERLEEFTNEASEKGNTRLPLLKSEAAEKRTTKQGLEARVRELESKKLQLQGNIEIKLEEIERAESEKVEKQQRLEELIQKESEISTVIVGKETDLEDLAQEISAQKEIAENNLKAIERLTGNLVPMQESLSGLEIEINRHMVNSDSLQGKIEDLERKRGETVTSIGSLEGKIEEYEDLKVEEAEKLEKMLSNIEGQVERQKDIRDTIRGANNLAKDAELTITQFTAKKDIWKKIVTEEKAQDRIREMGESGALKGYHGILRSLVKIDLKYQRAADTSSSNWSHAVVVDDVETIIDCIKGLKKNRLGMTHFIPLKEINPPELLDDIDSPDVLGYLPNIIRYDEKYEVAVRYVWGDTYVVKSRSAAAKLAREGHRAVTLAGDLFEPRGGVMGGHWRRPPDFSKLIPSDESIKELSKTIRALRSRLSKKMSDLKKSGGSLREFTGYMDHFNKNIEGIDQQIGDTQATIQRLERNIKTIDDNLAKLNNERGNELGLVETLQERKEVTLQEIERTKAEIATLKEHSKPSDVAHLERTYDSIVNEIAGFKSDRSRLQTEISVQSNLIEGYLDLKTSDQEGQIKEWRREMEGLERMKQEAEIRLTEIETSISELQEILAAVTSEVEATTKILERRRKEINRIERRIERLDRKRTNIERRTMSLEIELEKVRLQSQQRFEELARLGFEDRTSIVGVDLARVERVLRRIQREKRSLGMLNQRAIDAYEEDAYNYKMLSVRINELEKEKGSILNFIEEVEREKTEHFMGAFNEICENFSTLFEKLTGGGDGRLELQTPESPFSGGVDLYVQFPGKPMRLAAGASGGERSVAAIAYLLAIQKFLKSPFYLFDEIDAHLDDLNTGRLAEVLKENAADAQFLMVSLKDVMVHNADKIYGVFAQHGRSRVVALPMKVEVPV